MQQWGNGGGGTSPTRVLILVLNLFVGSILTPQLDPVLLGLDADLKLAGSEEDEQALKQQIKAREDALLPMYLQVSQY